jgi:hypothetical protein
MDFSFHGVLLDFDCPDLIAGGLAIDMIRAGRNAVERDYVCDDGRSGLPPLNQPSAQL